MSVSNLPEPPPGKTGWPWTAISDPIPETMLDGFPWPKISVVTPSYNQGQFIEETIRSVLLQGYPNLEFIIIDGGSSDNTLEIIKKYEHWLAYWVSEPDHGQGNAINKGISRATGDILFWLNSDDIVLPEAFLRVSTEFRKSTNVNLVIGQARIIDDQGQVIGELRSVFIDWVELATNPRNSVRQISTFFARGLFDKYGLVDETLHIAMDNELLVRLTQFTAPIIIQDYLSAYRVHDGAKTSHLLPLGYKETDKIRLRLLSSDKLRNEYRKRSASNWLSLVENLQFSRLKRLLYFYCAVRISPPVIIEKRFWTSIRKLITNS